MPDPHGDADSRTKDLLKTKLDLQLQRLRTRLAERERWFQGEKSALVPEGEVSVGSREKSALVPERSQQGRSTQEYPRRRSGCSCRKDTSLEVRPLLVLALLTNKTLLPSETRILNANK